MPARPFCTSSRAFTLATALAAALVVTALSPPVHAAQLVYVEPVVCLQPRPLEHPGLEPPPWAGLRRGLFDVCNAYRAGRIPATDYAAALEAYPALVLKVVAIQSLERDASTPAIVNATAILQDDLAKNPALRLLCRIAPGSVAFVVGATPLLTTCFNEVSVTGR